MRICTRRNAAQGCVPDGYKVICEIAREKFSQKKVVIKSVTMLLVMLRATESVFNTSFTSAACAQSYSIAQFTWHHPAIRCWHQKHWSSLNIFHSCMNMCNLDMVVFSVIISSFLFRSLALYRWFIIKRNEVCRYGKRMMCRLSENTIITSIIMRISVSVWRQHIMFCSNPSRYTFSHGYQTNPIFWNIILLYIQINNYIIVLTVTYYIPLKYFKLLAIGQIN